MWISWKYQTGQNGHKKENSVKLWFQRPEPLNQTSKKVNFFDGPWKYVEKSLFTLISSFSLIQKYFKEVLSKIVCNLLVHLLNITYMFYGISHPLCILIKNMQLVIRYTCLGIAKLIAKYLSRSMIILSYFSVHRWWKWCKKSYLYSLF